VEKELKDLVEQLGSAIDESIAGSESIAAIVHDMERAGYDLTLALEATMRLSPKGTPVEEDAREGEGEVGFTPALTPSGKFDLTPQDQEFLQALKVAI
jgi:hypothetical protein